MVNLRGWVGRLEKSAAGRIGSFELADGTVFRFEPDGVVKTMLGYLSASMKAVYLGVERPEPPELLLRIADARDRERAYRTVFPDGAPFMILERDALVGRGAIVPRPISTREMGEAGKDNVSHQGPYEERGQ